MYVGCIYFRTAFDSIYSEQLYEKLEKKGDGRENVENDLANLVQ